MGLVKDQCVELRKGGRDICGTVAIRMNGEWILWNVTAICKAFKISCLMGRHHMKGGSECPSMDQ